MRQFHDCSWLEAAEAILAMTSRLTVMKAAAEDKPMKELARCMESLLLGDIRSASNAAFDMTAALLTSGARRVSGDLMRDYLLHRLLIEPNPFSRMAAANVLDEALYNAMRVDMGILYELMGLDSADLYRYITERYNQLRVKTRPGLDDTTRLASAAWGGAVLRPKQDDGAGQSILPAMLPDSAPVWHYGDEEMRDTYAADEALEEMYHRLLEGGLDWSSMTEDVWNFFASYGTGDFLKYRQFMLRGERLIPLKDIRLSPVQPLMEAEYRACLEHCIEFMRGNLADPMLITGSAGMGKTTMLFSLADELPEMRFIYVPECRSITQLAPLFEELSHQPLKFMVALDDTQVRDFAVRAVPVNVLIAATASESEGCGMFTKCIRLKKPQLDGFANMVQRLLDAAGAALPREVVRSACVDCQVDTKGELTVATAVSVAEGLR